MTLHAVYTLASLGENKLVDSILAYFTFEAMSMIGVIASHNSFIENGKVADIAIIGAVGTNGGTIGQQEEVGIRGHLITTLCALEAVDMKERLPISKRKLDSLIR